jgi:hypothetical protein
VTRCDSGRRLSHSRPDRAFLLHSSDFMLQATRNPQVTLNPQVLGHTSAPPSMKSAMLRVHLGL